MSYSNVMLQGLSDEIKQEDILVADYERNIIAVTIVDSAGTFK